MNKIEAKAPFVTVAWSDYSGQFSIPKVQWVEEPEPEPDLADLVREVMKLAR